MDQRPVQPETAITPPKNKAPKDAGIALVSDQPAEQNRGLAETQAPQNLESTAAFVPAPQTHDPVTSVKKRADTTAAHGEVEETVSHRNEAKAPATGLKASPDTPRQKTAAPEKKQTAAPPEKKQTTAKGDPAASQTSKQLTTLGDFKLVSKLGQGGMGVVYKARQISLDRDVALKVLAKHLAENGDFVQRFDREAKIMAKLEHPNVLRCYAVGKEKGFHYMAMEFVEGGSMEGWLKKLGKLSVGDALHVVIACADALQYAHEQGMIHRDIKPDNILLTKKGIVKVADLGLAKAITEDTSLTRTGTGAGTPIYMAPEQARDAKHVDGRADIYSLGCMLYCFLAGQPPFKGETYVELLEAKQKGKFPEVRKFNADVPTRLDLFIGKMLVLNPDQRYQSCAEVIKDLEGLGIASRSLSFMESASAPATKQGTPSIKIPTGPTRVSAPAAGSASASKAASGQEQLDPDNWFVNYTSAKGKNVTKQMTTAQIIDLIRDDRFDEKTKCSRSMKENFRSLAAFREFEPILRHKIAQARADRKGAKLEGIYQKLDKQEMSRRRWRWFWNMIHNTGGGIGLILWIAAIGAIGFGLYYVGKAYLWPYVVSMFHLKGG
jgi:serine/threonine-protein kinase